MEILGQRDPRWANIYLGFSTTYIKDYGCTITCLAMILGTTPAIVNERLKAVNGFASGNLVIWAKIEEAFPGIKIRRVWSYDNADVKANVPNVLVEVPAAPIGGSGSHWVRYIGGGKLHDPWTAKERLTSDFPNPTGYCVITGAWKPPVDTTPTNNDDAIRLERDLNYNLFRSLTDTLGVHSDDKTKDAETAVKVIKDLQARPIEKVVEKIVTVEKPVEVVKEKVVEKIVEVQVTDSTLANKIKAVLYGKGFWWTKLDNIKKILPK